MHAGVVDVADVRRCWRLDDLAHLPHSNDFWNDSYCWSIVEACAASSCATLALEYVGAVWK